MISEPLVSVIIPVYNAAPYVRASLQSIVEQDYQNLEILVCDDASTDTTRCILDSISDHRIRLYRNDANLGYLRSINFLVSQSVGDFICFQDADDISHPKRIKIQVEELLNRPSLGFLGTNYAVISPEGKTLVQNNVETEQQKLKMLLQTSNPFQKPSILFRREVYNVIGMYREEFLQWGNISEDFDWILRASEVFDPGNVNFRSPLYLYRSVPTAMTKKIGDVNQFFGHAIALKLHRERMAGRKDSIQRGDLESIMDFISELRRPYELDQSLFHHRRAEALMYAGLRFEALRQAMHAVAKKPLRRASYRLLQYCIRKTLVRL